MIQDKELIECVRILKATGKIKNYYEIAEKLGMNEKSFYNWLSGFFNLSYGKKQKLIALIKEYHNGTISKRNSR